MVQKLWVLFKTDESSSPTKVSLEECNDIDDFAEKVKERFKKTFEILSVTEITIHPCNDGPELKPGLKIAELLNEPDFKNSDSKPLLIRYTFSF